MTADNDTYCINCFALIPADAEICPVCGASVSDWSAHDLGEKLLHALDHPSDEVRQRVITIMVLRHEQGAAMKLAEGALRHPLSYEESVLIINALADTEAFPDGRRALDILAQDHPSLAVRNAAEEALSRLK
jgi:hypothetical protein